MPTTQTTEHLPRIVELARDVASMLDDAYTYRTEGCGGDGCADCANLRQDGPRRIKTLSPPDPLCDDHAADLAIAEGYEQAVRAFEIEAQWAARDAAALDELAAIVHGTTAHGGAGELLSRVAAVLVDAGRQVSPTTD